MRKLTKKQMIMVGLAIAKVTTEKTERAFFMGVCVGPHMEWQIDCSTSRWDASAIRNALKDIAKYLPDNEASNECESIINDAERHISDIKARAVAAYPCENDQTRQHITFDGAYTFKGYGTEAVCFDGTTNIKHSPYLGANSPSQVIEEARLMCDFYLHPCDRDVMSDLCKELTEYKSRIANAYEACKEVTLNKFIEGGECERVLAEMGLKL